MGIDSYEAAKALIDANSELADFEGEKPESLIKLAEEALGLKFATQYRDFLETYGAGNFGSQEIYGIIDEDFVNSSVPDVVWYNQHQRANGQPVSLLAVYHTGADEVYCLDMARFNAQGEPGVVSYFPGFDMTSQQFKLVASDFGELLLKLVNREIES